MREWKPVSEKRWAKVKWTKNNLHPLVTMDTDLLSREVSNKNLLPIFNTTSGKHICADMLNKLKNQCPSHVDFKRGRTGGHAGT
jgi:hypothetical protein